MPKKERFTFKGIVYPKRIVGERNFIVLQILQKGINQRVRKTVYYCF